MYRWAKLLVELLNAWAWPLVAVLAILLLRPHLSALIQRLRSMKGLGIELSIAEASEELAKTEVVGPSPVNEDAPAADTSSQFLAAWNRVQGLLDELAQGQGVRGTSISQRVITLSQRGLIDDPLGNTILALRDVRNAFVHSKEQFDVSQLIAFVQLANQVASKLDSLLGRHPTQPGA